MNRLDKSIRNIAAFAVLGVMLAGCAIPMYPVQTASQASQPATEEKNGSASNSDIAAGLVTDIPTAQAFSQEPVSDADIQSILTAGINAPSAMNSQPWHFSVVSDPSVLQQIADGMSMGMPAGGKPPFDGPDGKDAPKPPAPGGDGPKAGLTDAPLAIVISCTEGKDFDAGLACQTMSIEAQLLGYGTKIISSPTIALNGENQAEYKDLLGIPEDQAAVAVLLIGREASDVDAVSGATERNAMDEVATIVGE